MIKNERQEQGLGGQIYGDERKLGFGCWAHNATTKDASQSCTPDI